VPWRHLLRAGAGLVLAIAMTLAVFLGCTVLRPLPRATTLVDRLALFPTDGIPTRAPVTIHWNAQAVPFIEAESDADLAFALGMVNAHLRLGQMTVMRRLVQGRLAEMFGPPARDIDHALRILDLGRAAPAIEAGLPDASRHWLAEFVRGINHYQERCPAWPHELAVLGVDPEPWRVTDILALGRLTAIDLHWLSWRRLLAMDPEHAQAMQGVMGDLGGGASPSMTAGDGAVHGLALLLGSGRTGSNVMAVAGSRTASGAAIIAGDPHVGVQLPPLWFIVGLKSPGIHAVGLTAPGLPVLFFGRNPDLAWGTTNMRALASELRTLSAEETESMTATPTTIATRWWFDAERILRESPRGPVVSDIPFLAGVCREPVALRWLGHRPSDEISPFLAIMRASDGNGIRVAFAPYATPGTNLLYADRHGNIGQIMAVALPRHRPPGLPLLVTPAAQDEVSWDDLRHSDCLPAAVNPPEGFLASANNLPAKDIGTRVGYVFPPDDRYRRMAGRLTLPGPVTMATLQQLQADVHGVGDLHLRDLILGRARDIGAEPELARRHADLWREFRTWDGDYRRDSRGAVAFQALAAALAEPVLATAYAEPVRQAILDSPEMTVQVLVKILPELSDEALCAILPEAARVAAQDAASATAWGDVHRLAIRHFLGAMPYLGRRYRFGESPYAGANATLQKGARERLGANPQRVRYGANARHVSDLSDPDENYFVLLGGQDGVINSANALDQVPLWLEHRYLRIPLTIENVRREFPHRLRLMP
jgi:penicillin amidase